jgi:hypothetical protein
MKILQGANKRSTFIARKVDLPSFRKLLYGGPSLPLSLEALRWRESIYRGSTEMKLVEYSKKNSKRPSIEIRPLARKLPSHSQEIGRILERTPEKASLRGSIS